VTLGLTRRIELLTRRLLRLRLLCMAALCTLAGSLTLMVRDYRLPGREPSLLPFVGAVMCGLALLLLVHRLATVEPGTALAAVVGHADNFVALIALNLMILNFIAPAFDVLALVETRNPLVPRVLGAMQNLTGHLLVGVFVVAAGALTCLVVIRFFDRVVFENLPGRRVFHGLGRVALAAVVAYCVVAGVIAYDGAFDTSPPVEHSTDVIHVHQVKDKVGLVSVWLLDVRSWRTPGGIERVVVRSGRDRLRPELLTPGQPVQVVTRSGLLGIPWVDTIVYDSDRNDRAQARALLELLPTAAYPRKWVMYGFVLQKRWDAIVPHALEYARYYPADRDYLEAVAETLRAHGRPEDAAVFERLLRASS
jgi:hypothetical protein